MTRDEVINALIDDKTIETIVRNINARNRGSEQYNNLKDLRQDIWLSILEMDVEKLVHLYESKQINFYLSRIVSNQINSQTSKYYYNYKKWDISNKGLNEENT